MVKTKEINNKIVIYLHGRMDVLYSGEIEKEINKIIEKNPNHDIVINLADIEYMSSSGLRVLVAIMRILKVNGRSLRLCNLNNAVRKIFEVVELMDMFDIYENEEAALA